MNLLARQPAAGQASAAGRVRGVGEILCLYALLLVLGTLAGMFVPRSQLEPRRVLECFLLGPLHVLPQPGIVALAAGVLGVVFRQSKLMVGIGALGVLLWRLTGLGVAGLSVT